MVAKRSAGVRQEERLLGLTTAELVAAAKESTEIASTWRVYRKEWLFARRFLEKFEAEKFAEQSLALYEPQDVEVREDGGYRPFTVWARKWNIMSEWKNVELAGVHREAILKKTPEADVQMVPRNSKEEHQLRAYGVLRRKQ